MRTICSFDDFVQDLREAGFSMGGEKDGGIFALSAFFGPQIRWHTEDAQTDPWEWRIRVLQEYRDLSYGKFFFGNGGYITKEWFPGFYAARRLMGEGDVTLGDTRPENVGKQRTWRRGAKTLEEEYEDGNVSREALTIYRLLQEYRELPAHLLRQYGGFAGKEYGPVFERALVQLQAGFYISICGQARKVSKRGEEYGWFSSVFCLTEDFWGEEVMREAEKTDSDEAYRKLEEQIRKLNPQAKPGRMRKFILG